MVFSVFLRASLMFLLLRFVNKLHILFDKLQRTMPFLWRVAARPGLSTSPHTTLSAAFAVYATIGGEYEVTLHQGRRACGRTRGAGTEAF